MRRSGLVLSITLALFVGFAPRIASARSVLVWGAPSARSSARKNIAVGRIEGSKSSKIRLSLLQALRESSVFSVTDAEDLKRGAGRSAIAKMAASLSVDAVLFGAVSKQQDLTLDVYEADGRLVDEIKVRGGSPAKLASAVRDEFDATIAPPLARASGATLGNRTGGSAGAPVEEEDEEPAASEATNAQPPTQEPAATLEEKSGAQSAREANAESPETKNQGAPKLGRAPFELTAGIRGYARYWKYTDLVGVRDPQYPRTLAPYRLKGAPALLVNGVVYPAAFWSDDLLANVGLMAGGELGVGTSTNYEQRRPDGSTLVAELKTQVQAWDIGLRGRIPFGPAELAPFVEYGSQSFILHGDEGGAGLAPLVPDVQYRYLRPGVEARVRVGRFSVAAHVAPRFLLTLHNVDLERVWFPNARGHGLDYGLALGFGLTSFLDVVAGGEFVGYGFDFNHMPLDPTRAPILAGGATDYYESLFLALRLTLGGSPRP